MTAWGRDAIAAPGEPPPYAADQLRRGQPFINLAVVFVVGVLLGTYWPRGMSWLVLATGPLAMTAMMGWRARRGSRAAARAAMCWGLVALVPLAAGWTALRTTHVSEHHITRYLIDEPQLAEVTGTIISTPYLRTPKRGEFGRFSYMPPATVFRLSLDSIVQGHERVPVTGQVLVRLDAAEHRLHPGRRISAKGWLAPIQPPSNPGEFDHRRRLAEQGVFARLTLRDRGNWAPIAPASSWDRWWDRALAWRGTLANEARRVLRAGMLTARDHEVHQHQRLRLSLLDAILLGQWSEQTREVHEAFRRVGLAHLMAISGAHLGILMGLVWLTVRLMTPQPRRAAAVTLAVLGVYMLIVPWRVPIVRAAIMAGMLCAGYGRGRGVSATGMLALAMVVVLIWRPGDLFNAGFQLSFGIVTALLLFTRPLALWIWPRPLTDAPVYEPWYLHGARRVVEFVAVSLIAFGVAMPVVAHHFEIVNPLAVLMSILALPVITLVLALGYVKMLAGALLPSASILLARPLAAVTDAMLALVDRAGDWPGTMVELTRPPPVAWVVAVLAIVVAALAGCFVQRRRAMLACAMVLIGWTVALQRADVAQGLGDLARRNNPATTLHVNMFAVGHGSAYLIRLGEHTLMYDCGSQPYLDVSERRILPALRRLGVRRIDTLFISHAHMDHYSGVLALSDAIDVGEVRAPPQFFQVAREVPGGAAAFLIAELEARDLPITPTVRGWSRRLGEARIDALWPPAAYTTLRPNDTSLVLRIEAGDRRLLMTGDMEQEAIDGLIARGDDTRADVAELPHHGGWVDSSPDWLDAVNPRVVLQSSAPPRTRRDPWAEFLAERGVTRLSTYELGMVELTMRPGEPIRWRAFRDGLGTLRTLSVDARGP